MGLLKGITIVLHEKTESGTDELNRPSFDEEEVEIENVLVYPMSQTEINDNYTMYGRKGVYTLGIPKGDTHTWVGGQVEFFDQTWNVIGVPVKGIDTLVPTDWNLKVYVEATNYGQ